jgi:neutral ceramidase
MLRAGAASRDVTPDLKGDFFGYVRPDLRVRGVAGRLWAHALVLDDGVRKVCLLTLDLGAPLITSGVREHVADLGFGPDNLIVAATHTHAGPSRPGAWITQQAAAAVREADARRRPARGAWAQVRLDDANRNRSLEAHLANHGLDLYPGTATDDLDPDGADHPRDVALRMLRIEDADGAPLAAWAHFSAHPTTIGPANIHFSADYPGTARGHFRRGFEHPPVAILTNGTEGDLIPRYDEVNQHALADRIGHRVADAMARAWTAAAQTSADLPVDGASERIVYAGQEVAPGQRVGSRAWFGLPFLGGGQNGPSFFYGWGLEGRRRPRLLAGRIQGRKLVAAPAPWAPAADVTVLRIGDRLLLSVPGEPTVETGRRMVAAALGRADTSVRDALVVGLAQAYRGYFTTPEEYDQQHYEGGHTVFGKHTSKLVELAHARLAERLASRSPAVEADVVGPFEPRGEPASDGAAAAPPVVAAPVGLGRRRARILRQPPARVARFETFELTWTGPRRGRGRPVGEPFLVLERAAAAGGWTAVDHDLAGGFVWHQRGRRLTARYEVPGDLDPGRYRVTVRGPRSPVSTDVLEVVASDRLLLLGVEAEGDDLVFRAQNPCPDPARVLRRRERRPRGGSVRYRVDGVAREAGWDEASGCWRAPVTTPPRVVHVPAGGLVDSEGNRSGPAADLTLGRVVRGPWPPNLGPGGGRPPGLFGLGAARRGLWR